MTPTMSPCATGNGQQDSTPSRNSMLQEPASEARHCRRQEAAADAGDDEEEEEEEDEEAVQHSHGLPVAAF